MAVGASNGSTVCSSQFRFICVGILVAVFVIAWWSETGWGQTLGLESGSLVVIARIQTPPGEISLESNLNLNFFISNFTDGTFGMRLFDNGKSRSLSTSLGLLIELSERMDMSLDFSSDGSFLQGSITPDDLSTSFSVDLDLDLDSLAVSLDAQLESSTEPNDPTDDENVAALVFELKANGGKGTFSLNVDLENSVFPLDPDGNETDLDIKAKAFGNLDPIRVNGETELNRHFEQDSDDPIGDENKDGCPGKCGVDDDKDGLIDEDTQGRQPGEPGYTNNLVNDDDEDGRADELTVETDFSNELDASLKLSSELLSFSGSVNVGQSGRLEDPTKTKREINLDSYVTLSLDSIDVEASLSQDQEQFTTKPAKDSNTLSFSLNVEVEVSAFTISGTLNNTQKTLPNDLVDNQQSSGTVLSVSFQVSETLSLDLTLLDLSKSSFPNDPLKVDKITDIKSLSLTFDLDSIEVGLSFERVEFPLDPEQNTMATNVSSLFSFCTSVNAPAFVMIDGFSCENRIEEVIFNLERGNRTAFNPDGIPASETLSQEITFVDKEILYFQFDLGTNLFISPAESNLELFLTFNSAF